MWENPTDIDQAVNKGNVDENLRKTHDRIAAVTTLFAKKITLLIWIITLLKIYHFEKMTISMQPINNILTATGGHFVCACVNMGCWRATEAFSVNCLRSVPAFAGCFLELNDVYWVLRSTNMFFKVSRYFYDESEFIVASLSPLRGQSFLS